MFRRLALLIFSAACIFSMFTIFNFNNSVDVFASTVGVPLQCSTGQFSLEKIESATNYKKIGCYGTFAQAVSAMNASSDKDLVVRHSGSLSPTKIVAMDRGMVVNVTDRAGGDQTLTTISQTYSYTWATDTYINKYNLLYYLGADSNDFAASRVKVSISGFEGYMRTASADLVPMIYIEKGWPILLAGDGKGKHVYSNIIQPNSYTVSSGILSYTYSTINPVSSNEFKTNAYSFFNPEWYRLDSTSGGKNIYTVLVDSIRIRSSMSTANNSNVIGDHNLNTGDVVVGERVGDWIKIESYQGSSVNRRAFSNRIGSYSPAPSWLTNGTYYSADGIHFFTDIDLTKPVNGGAAFYNYFQYLPARSYTTHTLDQLNKYIVDRGYTSRAQSAMFNSGEAFISGQSQYFMNGAMIYAMAIHESAYGRSSYALNRNNLFGWNAVDSNPGQATYFESVTQAIHEHMSINLRGYLSLNDARYAGNGLANKGDGFNRKYASDPYWGLKIANHMYQFDKSFGGTDLHNYALGKFPDNSNINVRTGPSTDHPILYTTSPGLKNTMAVVLEEVDGWYKIYLNNITNNTDVGYVREDMLTIVSNRKDNPFDIPEYVPSDFNVANVLGAKITDNVLHGFNLTTSVKSVKDKIIAASKDSTVLVTNAGGDTKADNTNLVTGDILTVTLSSGTKIAHQIAVKGDINGDGQINITDYRMIKQHLLGVHSLTSYAYISADVSGDNQLTVSDYRMIKQDLLNVSKLH